MSHAGPTPLDRAIKVWQSVFSGGPYTALKMVEYLMDAGHVTAEDFLKRPSKALKNVTAKYITDNQDINTMATTWNSATGRCTSFAVKASYTLSQETDGDELIYKFCIYDLGRHRIARCLKTGILIDSSSTVRGGAFVLKEGAWAKFNDTSASWKFISSESKFERNHNQPGDAPKSSATDITPFQAMVKCFSEVEAAAAESIPTLFRSVMPDGVSHFYGMVCWTPQARAIEMVRDLRNRDKKLVIQWPQQIRNSKNQPTDVIDASMVGSAEDLQNCVNKLTKFVLTYGGPGLNGPTQWKADRIREFSDKMFVEATRLWGNPKFVDLIHP